MRRRILLLSYVCFVVACASTSGQRQEHRFTDLELVMDAVASCADSVGQECAKILSTDRWSLEVSGSESDTWIVKSALEGALLSRGFSVIEASDGADSLAHSLQVRVLDLGIRHRAMKKEGLSRKPWILREGVCILICRCLDENGNILFSGESSGSRVDWTPAAALEGLSHSSFTPDLERVPTSSGLVGPLAVAGAAAGLLALFFVTSE